MKTHSYIARTPFNSRIGQFEDGKHTLCIGLDFYTLKAHPEQWRVYLGKKGSTYFEVDPELALKIGQQWTNNSGKVVLIVPLGKFKMVKANLKKFKTYEFDRENNVAKEIEPEPERKPLFESKQMSIL